MNPSHSSIKTGSETNLLNGPPPLPYSLHPRKKAIAITWTIILFDSCLLPITMFYALWFTKLSHKTGMISIISYILSLTVVFATVFNILSSIFGLPSFVHFVKRIYYLCKKDSTCRPIGGKRAWVSRLKLTYSTCV